MTTVDGVHLHARAAVPPQPRGALVLCHGLSVDKDENGAFEPLRDHAVRSGLAVLRFDFRAHGQSGGDSKNFRIDGARSDVNAILGLLSELVGDELPTVAIGLSFGCAGAVHAVATRPSAAGLVLWYPVVDYEHNFGPDTTVPLIRSLREARAPDEPEWVDIRVGSPPFLLPSALTSALSTDTTGATLAGLTIPVLAFHGTRDGIVDVEPLARLAREHAHIEYRQVRGAGHGFWLWRRWVIARTVAWASRACAASG